MPVFAFKFLSFFSGLQGKLLGLLLGSLLLFGSGFYTAWHVRSQIALSEVLQLRNQILTEVAETNAETVSKLQMANDKANSLALQLAKEKQVTLQQSRQLTESLNNVPLSNQNVLSESVLSYLKRLREYQSNR